MESIAGSLDLESPGESKISHQANSDLSESDILTVCESDAELEDTSDFVPPTDLSFFDPPELNYTFHISKSLSGYTSNVSTLISVISRRQQDGL